MGVMSQDSAFAGEALDDAELVQRATRGELSAFEHLVDRHRPVVIRVAARIVGSDEAEDVSQDAFLRAFHRLGHFRGDAPFRSWLLRITHNAALDHLARRRAGAGRPRDARQLRAEHGATAGRPPGSARADRAARTQAARPRPAAPRRPRAARRRGLTYEEIADITDTPLGSVKGRLHRARREFIEMLRANTYDWELPQ